MPATEADRAFLAGLTVLLVEDDPTIRDITALFLRRRVGRLCLAVDGQDGLEACRREKPDLLLTDIMMPRMDGLSLAQAIRAEVPDLPVVVITAFEQTRFLLRAIELGVDRFVVKPVQVERLESALLHCAHQLRLEEEHRLHLRAERDLMLARHHEAQCILAKGMAHDYNNLLQAIISSIGAASAQVPVGSPAHIVLGMAQRYSATAQHLGRQLIALGEDQEPVREPTDLDSLLAPLLRETPWQEGIRLDTRFTPHLPAVRFNPDRLRQAFEALLLNAQEAMPRGGTLEVGTDLHEVGDRSPQEGLGPGSYLHVSVRDSGIGIPPDILPRIFEPYFSTRETGSRKGQGLGLALCRAIIMAHGGQVSAESQPGLGSTFHVYLPVAGSPA